MSAASGMARTPFPGLDDGPRFYFSFRSPYSWLAYRDLQDRYQGSTIGLRWTPFWEPDARTAHLLAEAGGEFTYLPMSRAKHLYILQDIRRLAAARGLAVTWPVDRSPCWEVPHLAYLLAARYSLAREFADGVYRARWQENRDICDPTTVAEVAEGLGIDPVQVAGAAEDPSLRREGVDALLAVQRDGVFGVPFFVNRFDKYWGIDRLEAFVASMSSRGAVPPPSECEPVMAGRGGGSDLDHAGGCG